MHFLDFIINYFQLLTNFKIIKFVIKKIFFLQIKVYKSYKCNII